MADFLAKDALDAFSLIGRIPRGHHLRAHNAPNEKSRLMRLELAEWPPDRYRNATLLRARHIKETPR